MFKRGNLSPRFYREWMKRIAGGPILFLLLFSFFLLRLSAYFLPSSTPRSSNIFLFFISISSLSIIKYFFFFSSPYSSFPFPYLSVSLDRSPLLILYPFLLHPLFFLLSYITHLFPLSLSLSLFSLVLSKYASLFSPFEFHPSPSSIIFYLSSSRSSTFLLHFSRPRPSLRLILSAAPLPSF